MHRLWTRRALGILAGGVASAWWARGGRAADLAVLRLGVLQFGTVSWELDVIRHHGLDRKNGFALEVQPFAQGDAADVALLAGAVDGIVEDWLWVSRQRADGMMLTFIPYSSAVGALMVHPDRGIAGLADLEGKKIGVAGGPLDKSWLILQGVARKRHGLDLAKVAEPVYAAPPLLTEKLKSGELDAVLNYWHFCARLEAAGFPQLIGINEAQAELGVPATAPQLGYVFKEAFVEANPELIRGFAAASRAAKEILTTSDGEWERIRPLTRAEDDATLAALRRRWVAGIVPHWGEAERQQAAELYRVLAELGGPELVGGSPVLAEGTFWAGLSY
jgi:NitT/TauT family transport system substrate-binding protein